MTVLNAAERKRIPAAKFAGPNRSYPVEDEAHGRNALARAAQAVKAGRMTAAEHAHIVAMVHRLYPEIEMAEKKGK